MEDHVAVVGVINHRYSYPALRVVLEIVLFLVPFCMRMTVLLNELHVIYLLGDLSHSERSCAIQTCHHILLPVCYLRPPDVQPQ